MPNFSNAWNSGTPDPYQGPMTNYNTFANPMMNPMGPRPRPQPNLATDPYQIPGGGKPTFSQAGIKNMGQMYDVMPQLGPMTPPGNQGGGGIAVGEVPPTGNGARPQISATPNNRLSAADVYGRPPAGVGWASASNGAPRQWTSFTGGAMPMTDPYTGSVNSSGQWTSGLGVEPTLDPRRAQFINGRYDRQMRPFPGVPGPSPYPGPMPGTNPYQFPTGPYQNPTFAPPRRKIPQSSFGQQNPTRFNQHFANTPYGRSQQPQPPSNWNMPGTTSNW